MEAEVVDVAASEGVFVFLTCSMELLDAVCVDWEALEGDC